MTLPHFPPWSVNMGGVPLHKRNYCIISIWTWACWPVCVLDRCECRLWRQLQLHNPPCTANATGQAPPYSHHKINSNYIKFPEAPWLRWDWDNPIAGTVVPPGWDWGTPPGWDLVLILARTGVPPETDYATDSMPFVVYCRRRTFLFSILTVFFSMWIGI